MIHYGDRGMCVWQLQKGLKVKPDGIFGTATEEALRGFQVEEGLGVDGVFGSASWFALVKRCEREGRLREVWPKKGWVRLEFDERVKPFVKAGTSYNRLYIREDFAPALRAAIEDLEAAGCVLTTSGSRRQLNARVSASRSATSMHYMGRAIDLGIYTGGQNPLADPFLVAEDEELGALRWWRVFARVDDSHAAHPRVEKRRLRVLSARVRGLVEVEAFVVDVTARLEEAGFVGIGARRKSWAAPFQHYLGTEWWHFQTEVGLEDGLSTFGDELLTMFDLETLEHSGPWAQRKAVFGERFL